MLAGLRSLPFLGSLEIVRWPVAVFVRRVAWLKFVNCRCGRDDACLEAVANAADGHDPLLADLAAQTSDQHLDCVLAALIRIPVKLASNFFVTENAVGTEKQ